MPDLTLPQFSELWQSTLNWLPTEQQQGQFQALLTQICALNETVNLTRITSPDGFWEKHLWDSLWGIQPWLPAPLTPLRVIDVGTGGGFPGYPVAIALAAWQVTLLDSTRKKVACLETLCQSLALSNAHPLCDRAEILGQQAGQRATYDIALIRAVGPVLICAEYTLPFLKIGGTAILYRGQWSLEEEQVLQQALPQLGGELTELRTTTTPLTHAQRHCVYLNKIKPTPAAFPRKAGLPAQCPLGV